MSTVNRSSNNVPVGRITTAQYEVLALSIVFTSTSRISQSASFQPPIMHFSTLIALMLLAVFGAPRTLTLPEFEAVMSANNLFIDGVQTTLLALAALDTHIKQAGSPNNLGNAASAVLDASKLIEEGFLVDEIPHTPTAKCVDTCSSLLVRILTTVSVLPACAGP